LHNLKIKFIYYLLEIHEKWDLASTFDSRHQPACWAILDLAAKTQMVLLYFALLIVSLVELECF
jgi:hypothetical protein